MIEIQNPSNAAHRATFEPLGRRVEVHHAGVLIADSVGAMLLTEESAGGEYPGVIYVPRVDMSAALTPVDAKSTHCPLKGDASYLAHAGEDVAWIYYRPLEGAKILADYVAFYADRVDFNQR